MSNTPPFRDGQGLRFPTFEQVYGRAMSASPRSDPGGHMTTEEAGRLLAYDHLLDTLDFDRSVQNILAAFAAEREACAQLAESKCAAWNEEGNGESILASQALYGKADAGREIAAAIRARGER